MKSVKETAQELLLKGERINKSEFHDTYHTFTLTQRIEEIRKDGWDVKSKTIPGRRGMVEYWLEPQEIARLKNQPHTKRFEDENEKNEQLTEPIENLVETASTVLKNDEAIYEQVGLGLPWQL